MAEDNKLRDLNREYWVRVHDMCAGTDVNPWECVRIDGEGDFHSHPRFGANLLDYEFAVAILEDKPVFFGDVVYSKTDGCPLTICRNLNAICIEEINNRFSWYPPKPKRTFTLNGVELPCPISDPEKQRRAKYQLDIAGSYFYYDDAKEFGKVAGFLEDILTEARDNQ